MTPPCLQPGRSRLPRRTDCGRETSCPRLPAEAERGFHRRVRRSCSGLGASLAATTFFYGYGLGFYGQLSRLEAWLFAPALWAVMLLWSKPWLDRFNYGPFEWLWRSLARWQVQPMRGEPRPPATAEYIAKP